jgi:uncharacterized coiled-coil protein SlyX
VLKGSQRRTRQAAEIGSAREHLKALVSKFNQKERSAIAKKAAAGQKK